MPDTEYTVRDAYSSEFEQIGQLMVQTYANLEGFFSPEEQPDYFEMLANIGKLTERPTTRLLVAVSSDGSIGGGVIYIGDMAFYGSGGTATQEKNAAGFRLLAVDPSTRGKGIGKLLTHACIEIAKEQQLEQLVIHTTEAMQVAWKMYEKIGFERSTDLDFKQKGFPVFGFRMKLS